MSLRVRACALDAVHGRPAAGVPVSIEVATGAPGSAWSTVARGATGENGSWTGETGEAPYAVVLRLVLDTGGYYAGLGVRASCQEMIVGLRLAGCRGAVVTALVAPAGGTAHVRFDRG